MYKDSGSGCAVPSSFKPPLFLSCPAVGRIIRFHGPCPSSVPAVPAQSPLVHRPGAVDLCGAAPVQPCPGPGLAGHGRGRARAGPRRVAIPARQPAALRRAGRAHGAGAAGAGAAAQPAHAGAGGRAAAAGPGPAAAAGPARAGHAAGAGGLGRGPLVCAHRAFFLESVQHGHPAAADGGRLDAWLHGPAHGPACARLVAALAAAVAHGRRAAARAGGAGHRLHGARDRGGRCARAGRAFAAGGAAAARSDIGAAPGLAGRPGCLAGRPLAVAAHAPARRPPGAAALSGPHGAGAPGHERARSQPRAWHCPFVAVRRQGALLHLPRARVRPGGPPACAGAR